MKWGKSPDELWRTTSRQISSLSQLLKQENPPEIWNPGRKLGMKAETLCGSQQTQRQKRSELGGQEIRIRESAGNHKNQTPAGGRQTGDTHVIHGSTTAWFQPGDQTPETCRGIGDKTRWNLADLLAIYLSKSNLIYLKRRGLADRRWSEGAVQELGTNVATVTFKK